MYFDETIHIEEEDQCYTCEYFLKGVTCPLLEALAMDVVSLNDDVLVRNCGFYKEFKRRLYVIEPNQTNNPTPEGSERKTGF